MCSTILRRLCYVSRSLIDGDAEVKSQEFARLLTVSRASNWRLGVTGMLMDSEDCFAQILEGGPDAVGEIYGKILRDDRHTDITLLGDGQVDERAFSDWALRSFTGLSWPNVATMRPEPLHRRLFDTAHRLAGA